jgi:thiamine-phosphate pyrophosphorylase
MNLPTPPLLLITDRRQAHGSILDIASTAFAVGCRWVSLREKDLSEAEQDELLRALLFRARPYQAKVTLHGDPQLVRHAGVDGVHLPAGSDTVAARRMLGKDTLIGVSIHGVEGARKIDPAVVDYVIAGPLFETMSKPGYGPALGPEGLAFIVKASAVPALAIGGITPESLPACLMAGASGVAVMGSVMRADDPGKEIMNLLAAYPRPR